MDSGWSGTRRNFQSAVIVPPQGAKTNVQTNTYERSEGRTKVRFILPIKFCSRLNPHLKATHNDDSHCIAFGKTAPQNVHKIRHGSAFGAPNSCGGNALVQLFNVHSVCPNSCSPRATQRYSPRRFLEMELLLSMGVPPRALCQMTFWHLR